MHSSPEPEGIAITIDSLSKLLNCDFGQIVLQAHERIYGTDPAFDLAAGVSCTLRSVNIAHLQNMASDYLVDFDYPSTSVFMFFAFVRQRGSAPASFSCTSEGRLAAPPTLVDIDSDGRMELLFTDDLASPAIERSVHLWRYQNQHLEEIFRQGLVKTFDAFPYSYENHFRFSKNPHHAHLLDIVFQVNTQTTFDDSAEAIAFYKEYGNIYALRDSATFVFNGKRYLPGKSLMDYDAPIRQYHRDHNN